MSEIGRMSGELVHMARDKRDSTGMHGGHDWSGVIHRRGSGLEVDGTTRGDLVRDPVRIDGNSGW